MIDRGEQPTNALTIETVRWVHQQFYERLPNELRWVDNPDTGEKIQVMPGTLREKGVAVGRHIPPNGESLPGFLTRFQNAYDFRRLSRLEQLIAIGAAHHRLLWIHPFYDGNGRVARLISHAAFREAGVGNDLWSVSRGLARNASQYRAMLNRADSTREGDLDGRGSLSQKHLIGFCAFFLEVAIDQASYMQSLLELPNLLARVDAFAKRRIQAKALPRASDRVLREMLIVGEIERKAVAGITGYSDRQARASSRAQ